jgi:hypothetical protein
VIDPNFPGYVWIRENTSNGLSSPRRVFLPASINIQLKATTPVELGYDKFGRECVMTGDSNANLAAGINTAAAVQNQQTSSTAQGAFETLRCVAQSTPSMVVTIKGWPITTASGYTEFPGSTIDLSTPVDYRPSTGNMCYAVIAVKNDYATLEVATSTPRLSSDLPLGPADASEAVALLSAGSTPVWAVKLVGGQTVITQQDIDNDGKDLRQLVNSTENTTSPLTTKGDLYSYSTTSVRFPVGVDNADLIADSAQTTGLRWRNPLLAVAYNYRLDSGIISKVGFGLSSDGRSFSRKIEPAIDIGAGGTWDDEQTHDPCLVVVNGIIWAFYSGYDGSHWKIGLARSFDGGLTFTKYASSPILSAAGGWESTGSADIGFPTVLYDVSETDASRRWKLWYYGGLAGSGGIGYAYSADGLSWTKYASNPILAPSTGWQSLYVDPGAIVKLGLTYYLFYDGTDSGGTQSSGLLTFTDPQGTYSGNANNPLLVGDGITTAISVSVIAGDTSIAVTSSAVFPIGAAVQVYDGTNKYLSYVTSLPDSTHVVLFDAAPVAISSTGGNVRSVAYNSVNIRSALYDGGWTFGLVGFQPLFDTSHLHEFSILGYADDDLARIYIDYSAGLILRPTLVETQADNVSMENPSIVSLTDTPQRFRVPPTGANYQTVQVDGTPLAGEPKLDFVSGNGISLTGTDDSANNRSKVTVTAHVYAPLCTGNAGGSPVLIGTADGQCIMVQIT